MGALKHLNKYFYRYRYRLILGMCFVIASNLFMPFQARFVSITIDILIENLGLFKLFGGTGMSETMGKLVLQSVIICSAFIVVFALIRGFFMYLMRQSIIVMSRLIEFDLKNEVFDHYQQLSAGFYRKNNTGDLMARISEDVSRVRMYIGPAIMYYTNLVATFLVVIPIMFSVNARLAALVLLPLPVLSYAIFYVNNIINRRSDKIQRQLSVITGFVQETFSGIRVIKAFGAEHYFREDFKKEAELYKQRSMGLAKVDATFFPLMTFLTGMSTLITIFVGGLFVIRGEVSVGNIAEFVIYVNLLTWPVASLGWTTSLVQRAAASQQRLNEFLHTAPDIVSGDQGDGDFTSSIVFNNVSYCYPGKTSFALKDINITIRKGETLAVLGTTGSGKTTLVQLLLRVMDVSEGEVLIDGKDIRQVNLIRFKAQVGYAPQDVFLFSDTIFNNIAFGLKSNEVKPELVEKAAEQAALSDNIRDFPAGFGTLVGERGITLSGGQKQRVSIARALIRDPELYIFDDSLSAVDTKTEAEILGNLKAAFTGKTAVIISHRVSTVKDAGTIIVLDEGRIVERGSHEELMALGGKYAGLYMKQLAEEKP